MSEKGVSKVICFSKAVTFSNAMVQTCQWSLNDSLELCFGLRDDKTDRYRAACSLPQVGAKFYCILFKLIDFDDQSYSYFGVHPSQE